MSDSADETLPGTLPGDGTRAMPGLREPQRGDVIGRYVVLRKLGAGGMGVVFAAYDPELDRRVALKLLHAQRYDETSAGDGQRRLLREAQAMAKLGDPNVLAVHDVGEHEGRVYLAMEFIEGMTLGRWCEAHRPGWREALGLVIQAGRGLVAAHAQHLVHCDFKPDNVMVDEGGRVRVMDFGLARPSLVREDETAQDDLERSAKADGLDLAMTREGAVVGTPAYMAPEQHAGEKAGPAADQFAFCVVAWELVLGQRPFAGDTLVALSVNVVEGRLTMSRRNGAPKWVRRALTRGLAVDPNARWPSIATLLAELERGQTRARARTIGLGLGAVALLGAGARGYQQWDLARRVSACGARGATIGESWNEDARARVQTGLTDNELSYAGPTADRVVGRLDAVASAWSDAARDACMARIDGTLPNTVLPKAEWCLDDRREQLEAVVQELSTGGKAVVGRAVRVAAALEPASTCTDAKGLGLLPDPPPPESRDAVARARTRLTRAQTLQDAGRYEDALALARDVVAETEDLDWPPTRAAAHILHGELLARTAEYERGEAAILEGYAVAAEAGAWDTAARAANDLILDVGYRRSRPAEGRVWARHAEIAIAHAADPLELLEARRAANLAVLLWSSGEYEQAMVLHARALAIREAVHGPNHPEVAIVLSNMGVVQRAMGAHEGAIESYERALAIDTEALSPEHPDIAISLNNIANVRWAQGRYDDALAMHERALAARERALGPDHPEVADSLVNIAAVQRARGEPAEAIALYERALAITRARLGPVHPDVALILHNLGIAHKALSDGERARSEYAEAIRIWEQTKGPRHPEVALALTNLGRLELDTGHVDEAVALLERAVEIHAQTDDVDVAESIARATLARALRAHGDDRRALEEAARARAGFESAEGDHHAAIAELDAWLQQ
ncbi:serine/threonine-protein kinase [Paraliomyxa miuraensis]|uniref:serine/threonine-protein kinase n=1 Tax=Paraliomyxa miuraensis TaxID=376150 RepID=UPI002250CF7F|nr:serine/threonine-protein kinase [Paraliomyxa miuraensis]MCX4243990.1 tetratricopeptide repeat protein [Paraliomyxa miuraensis]